MSNQRALSSPEEGEPQVAEAASGAGDAGGIQLSSEQARLLLQAISRIPQQSNDTEVAQLLALLSGSQAPAPDAPTATPAHVTSSTAPSALEQLNAAIRGTAPASTADPIPEGKLGQGHGAGPARSDRPRGAHPSPRDGSARISGSGSGRDAPVVPYTAPGDSAGRVSAGKAPEAQRKQRREDRSPTDPGVSAGNRDASPAPRKRHAPNPPVARSADVDPYTERFFPGGNEGCGALPVGPGAVGVPQPSAAQPTPVLSHDDLEVLREIISLPIMAAVLGPVRETMALPPDAILRTIANLPSQLLPHIPMAHLSALSRMLPQDPTASAAVTAPLPAAQVLPGPMELTAPGALSSALLGLAAPPASFGASTTPLQASQVVHPSLPPVTLGSQPAAYPGLALSAPPALPLPASVPWPPAPAFPRSDALPPSALPPHVTAPDTGSPASAGTQSPGNSHDTGLDVPQRHGEIRGRVPWSKEEDDVLLSVIGRFGPQNWRLIAAVLNQEMEAQLTSFQPRSDRQCRQRWTNNLDTSLRRTPFSPEEDEIILAEQARHGNKWAQIARALPPGRTGNQVKNHWYTRLKEVSEKRGLTRAEPVHIPPALARLVRGAPTHSAPAHVVSQPLPLTINAQQRPADGWLPPPLPSWGRRVQAPGEGVQQRRTPLSAFPPRSQAPAPAAQPGAPGHDSVASAIIALSNQQQQQRQRGSDSEEEPSQP
ncbi:unnamed protein product [Pedinophyceae sp. YPF-701]|nr:unnamed protein product [Pedinophyceae sp. YPF-701]